MTYIKLGSPVAWRFKATASLGIPEFSTSSGNYPNHTKSARCGFLLGDAGFSIDVIDYYVLGLGYPTNQWQYRALGPGGLTVTIDQADTAAPPTFTFQVDMSVQEYLIYDDATSTIIGHERGPAPGTNITYKINSSAATVAVVGSPLSGALTLVEATLAPIDGGHVYQFATSGASITASVVNFGPLATAVPTVGVTPLSYQYDDPGIEAIYTGSADGKTAVLTQVTYPAWNDPFTPYPNPTATGETYTAAGRADAFGGAESNVTIAQFGLAPIGGRTSALGDDYITIILRCYAENAPTVSAHARTWPGNGAISGMSIQFFNASLGDQIPDNLTSAYAFARTGSPDTTDGSGNASYSYWSRQDGQEDDPALFGGHLELRPAAHATDSYGWDYTDFTSWLYQNRYDPRQPIVANFITYTGNDMAAYKDLYAWAGPILTVTKAASYVVDDGQQATHWFGATGAYFDAPAADTSGHWTITQAALGATFCYDPAFGIPGNDYNVARTGFSPSIRRSFRNYRYCQIKINVDQACTVRFVLRTWDGTIGGLAWETQYEWWDLTLAAGDNTAVIDLAAGIRSNNPLFPTDHVLGDWSAATLGATGTVSNDGDTPTLFDTLGECVLRSYLTPLASDTDDQWRHNDVWSMKIAHLTPGITYRIDEIRLKDIATTGYTPLRVLGDPIPLGSSADISQRTTAPACILRVLANGRPACVFPVANQELVSGVPTTVMIGDLVTAWRNYMDQGAGIWTITVHNSTLANTLPANLLCLTGTPTATSFTLSAVARSNVEFPILPGFTELIGAPLMRWDLGGQLEGIVLDYDTRKPVAFADIGGEITYPPAITGGTGTPATTNEGLVTTDIEGYFAAPDLHQPVYVGLPATGGSPPLTIEDVNHDWKLIAPTRVGGICNLAPSSGSFHRAAPRLVAGVQEGLLYWRKDNCNAAAWDASSVVITDAKGDCNPSLAYDHRGRLICQYDRWRDGSLFHFAAGHRNTLFLYVLVDGARVMETVSDDDGDTWKDALMTIPGGLYPEIEEGHDGSLYRAAYVDDGMGTDTGTIQAQWQAPGDPAPSAVFTLMKADGVTPIAVQKGSFGLAHMAESAGRWILTVLEVGNTTPTEWVSADDSGGSFVPV